jgi:hypothetical protein
MSDQANVHTLIGEDEVESFEQALNALELSLATVQKVIERNVNVTSPEDKYNGVHLTLYVMHTKAVLMLCRKLLQLNEGATS